MDQQSQGHAVTEDLEDSEQRKPILLADSACLPTSALAEARRKEHWQLLPYETTDFSGVMLSASSPPNANSRLRVSMVNWAISGFRDFGTVNIGFRMISLVTLCPVLVKS